MGTDESTRIDRVLIVGAGAVGQVYARHLQRAGVKVDLYVRPQRVEQFRNGFWMYPLNDRKLRDGGEHIHGMGVYSTPEELRGESFDQVWLCVSSPALAGSWLKEVLDAAAPKSLVSMTPGYRDEELLRPAYAGPLVRGLIQFMSYQTPMSLPKGWPTNDRMEKEALRDQPGVAYWLPPAAKGAFGGDVDTAKAVVRVLKRGGFPATYDRSTVEKGRFGSAILMPLIAALQVDGWRFDALKRGPHLRLAMSASREILEVMAADLGRRPPFWRRLLRPWLGKLMMALSRRLMPFDIEVFLAYHFTKVGDQTVAMLATFKALTEQKTIDAPALRKLADLRA